MAGEAMRLRLFNRLLLGLLSGLAVPARRVLGQPDCQPIANLETT
jgi:hypothetical protein